jgi:Holliday junction resolvase RusA-like endonuclease
MPSFFLEIKPVSKGRPRLGRSGTYTPKKTAQYEAMVKSLMAINLRGIQPTDKPIVMELVFNFKSPKSHKRKGIAPNTARPDIDNLAKAVLDALNGVVYLDDCQIHKITISKIWNDFDGVQISWEIG